MHNFYSFFLRALLAVSIAISAPAALAGPQYRVSFDTSSFAGTTGFLDLGFNSVDDGSNLGQAVASLSNFSGAFLGNPAYLGDVSGNVNGGVIMVNSGGENFFTQAVNFGGLFSFDVHVDRGDNLFGALFTVALLNDAFDTYLGADAELLTIDLVPGVAGAITNNAPGLAQVAEVPEPGEWLLLATGLLLIGATRRRYLRG